MGKKVIHDDYAKPLFTRLYRADRKKLDELKKSFPPVPIGYPRKGQPTTRKITDTEVVRIAIDRLHRRRTIYDKRAKKNELV